jgi:hypothetical protein
METRRVLLCLLIAACLHVEATLALDVHEERVGALYQALQLVLLLLQLRWRVQQIDIGREHLQMQPEKRSGTYVIRVCYTHTNL